MTAILRADGWGVATGAQASRQAGRRIWLVEEPRRRPLSRPGLYATSAIMAVSVVEVAEDVCPGRENQPVARFWDKTRMVVRQGSGQHGRQ